MAEKKFYWLKLRDDFFTQKAIKKLRKIAGGDTFTIIYLKMQLLSLKSEGKLIFENIEESLAEELALMLDEKIENVNVTLMFLQKYKLIEELNCEEYLLPKVCDNIGREGSSAERVRRHRERKKTLQCNTHVTQNVTCNTEKRERVTTSSYIDTLSIIDTLDKKDPSVRQSMKSSYVNRDKNTLAEIIKVAQVESFPETTAMFIKHVITRLWEESTLATTLQMNITHQEIRDRLRLCRLKHLDAAMARMKNWKTNKEIYFAKCLLTAIVERDIEEIFEEE